MSNGVPLRRELQIAHSLRLALIAFMAFSSPLWWPSSSSHGPSRALSRTPRFEPPWRLASRSSCGRRWCVPSRRRC